MLGVSWTRRLLRDTNEFTLPNDIMLSSNDQDISEVCDINFAADSYPLLGQDTYLTSCHINGLIATPLTWLRVLSWTDARMKLYCRCSTL
jgi:hypothetical protein